MDIIKIYRKGNIKFPKIFIPSLFLFFLLLMSCTSSEDKINKKLVEIKQRLRVGDKVSIILKKYNNHLQIETCGKLKDKSKILEIENELQDLVNRFNDVSVSNNIVYISPCDKWLGHYYWESPTPFLGHSEPISTDVTIAKTGDNIKVHHEHFDGLGMRTIVNYQAECMGTFLRLHHPDNHINGSQEIKLRIEGNTLNWNGYEAELNINEPLSADSDNEREKNATPAKNLLESNTSQFIDYTQTIRAFVEAEDKRDIESVLMMLSDEMQHYYEKNYPAKNELRTIYNINWNKVTSSINSIDKIEKLDNLIYELYSRFTFTGKKSRETKTVNSKVKFEFDNEGKISSITQIRN